MDPGFLKYLIERIIQLEYMDTKEALNFFKGIK